MSNRSKKQAARKAAAQKKQAAPAPAPRPREAAPHLPQSALPPPPERIQYSRPSVMGYLESEMFLNAPDSDNLGAAAVLHELLNEMRGIRTDVNQLSADMARVREEIAAREAAEERWKNQQQAMINEWAEQSARVPAERRAQAQAQAAVRVQHLTQEMLGNSAQRALSVQQKLAAEKTVTLVRPGKLRSKRGDHGPEMVLESERYALGGIEYVFLPGVPQAVPASIAQMIADSDRSVAETRKREALLTQPVPLQDTVLRKEWGALDREYNSPTHDPSTYAADAPAGMPTFGRVN